MPKGPKGQKRPAEVIAKAGKPMARLVALASRRRPRNFGALKGQIWMADDFDELPKETLDTFYEGEDEPDRTGATSEVAAN
jgi:antitoxin (DNA-binding transcriptional repressor) of toxin-antitoxin stability system